MLRCAQHDIYLQFDIDRFPQNFGIPEAARPRAAVRRRGRGASVGWRSGPVHAPRMRPVVFRFADERFSPGHRADSSRCPGCYSRRRRRVTAPNVELHPEPARETKQASGLPFKARLSVACLLDLLVQAWSVQQDSNLQPVD